MRPPTKHHVCVRDARDVHGQIGGIARAVSIEEGDSIVLDIENRRLEIELSDDEIKQRLARWKKPAPCF